MAAVPIAPPPPAPETPALSQGARILDTFIAPSKTFMDIRRSASWWAPFLLFVIALTAFNFVVDKQIGFRAVTESQIKMSPKAERQLDQLPPADREKQVAMRTAGTKYFSLYGGVALVVLVIQLIIAGLYLATFKFALNAKLTYKAALAVVIYAGLPEVLRFLLAIVSIYSGVTPDTFNIQNPIMSNPGYLLNPVDAGAFLYGVASSLDIFRIWAVVLAGIGLACVSGVKRSTSLVVTFGWFIFLTLFFVGLGAAFS
jgi:Yip1 domain